MADTVFSARTSARVYREEIVRAWLEPALASQSPTAVFVFGAAGAAHSLAILEIAKTKPETVQTPVVISSEELRLHHPAAHELALSTPRQLLELRAAAETWSDRLVADAISRRANVIDAVDLRQPVDSAARFAPFLSAGYRIEASFIALSLERAQRAYVGRALDALARDQLPPTPRTSKQFDREHRDLRSALSVTQDQAQVHLLRVIRPDGFALHRNSTQEGRWEREAIALNAFDKEAFRPTTPLERAENAIAWLRLVARAEEMGVPTFWRDLAREWQTLSRQKAEASPASSKHFHQRVAAEAFRTLPPDTFLNQFPGYEGAIERLEQAKRHAHQHYPFPDDRAAFVRDTRTRLATQIEEGRQFDRVKLTEKSTRSPGTPSR